MTLAVKPRTCESGTIEAILICSPPEKSRRVLKFNQSTTPMKKVGPHASVSWLTNAKDIVAQKLNSFAPSSCEGWGQNSKPSSFIWWRLFQFQSDANPATRLKTRNHLYASGLRSAWRPVLFRKDRTKQKSRAADCPRTELRAGG